MSGAVTYDAAIIGGGLAGLCLALQLREAGKSVILFEKEHYPMHRVCGEYISNESTAFLKSLGLNTDLYPSIRKLTVTAPDGTRLSQDLPLGGIGISRYRLDAFLAGKARSAGVMVQEGEKVTQVEFMEGWFNVTTSSGNCSASVVAGTFGKRSNLDLRWNRPFVQQKPSKLNNYIGVKYHVRIELPKDRIALHNFRDGYCGISAVEDDRYCLCYLTTAANLEAAGNNIRTLEQEVLFRNPELKQIFQAAEFLYEKPLTISQVSFDRKSLVEDHVLMVGDAAGMITPLCGNGMSMAMHAAKMASAHILSFLAGTISRHEMERRYEENWKSAFSARLRTGRAVQSMFGKPAVTNLFIRAMRPFPSLVRELVKSTHGQPF
jgi:flavin-dependent dehydrogenase